MAILHLWHKLMSAHRRVGSKEWSIADRIHKIRVPVLLITASEDMIQSYAHEAFFSGVKKVRWISLEHSSHLPFWEERENYMDILRKWLDGVNGEKRA